jgi:hypothetical protein
MKILSCGDILSNDSWKILLDRLTDLQKSSNGPFDLLIMTGILTIDTIEQVESIEKTLFTLKLSVIAFECNIHLTSSELTLPLSFTFIQMISKGDFGLFYTKENLSIAYFFPSTDPSSVELDKLYASIDNVGYNGCDFLISSYWPSYSERELSSEQREALFSSGITKDQRKSDVLPLFLMKLCPRYVLLSHLNGFYQRSPFPLVVKDHKMACRLITLHKITNSKEKHHKYLHALSLNPLLFMKTSELEIIPPDATMNPYDFVLEQPNKRMKGSNGGPSALQSHFVSSSSTSAYKSSSTNSSSDGFAVPKAPNLNLPSQPSGSFFFNNQASSTSSSSFNRNQPNRRNTENTAGEANSTLFIGGLGQVISEEQLSSLFPNAKHIKQPKGKGYAFVEFPSFHEANSVYLSAESNGGNMNAFGRNLTVGWSSAPATSSSSSSSSSASSSSFGNGDNSGNSQQRFTGKRKDRDEGNSTFSSSNQQHSDKVSVYVQSLNESLLTPPNDTSCVLYVGNIPSIVPSSSSSSRGGHSAAPSLLTPSAYEDLVKGKLEVLFPSSISINYKFSFYHYAFLEFKSFEEAKKILEEFYNSYHKYCEKLLAAATTAVPPPPPPVTAPPTATGVAEKSENKDEEPFEHDQQSKQVQQQQHQSQHVEVDRQLFKSALFLLKYHINSQPLILRWSKGATSSSSTDAAGGSNEKKDMIPTNSWNLLNEHPYDCKVLFIGNIPTSFSDEDTSSSFDLKEYLVSHYSLSSELLGSHCLLSLRHPEGKDYAFLEFSSSQQALDVMRYLLTAHHEILKKEGRNQRNTSAGEEKEEGREETAKKFHYLKFGWAKGKAADKQIQSENCWFCLASPTVAVSCFLVGFIPWFYPMVFPCAFSPFLMFLVFDSRSIS